MHHNTLHYILDTRDKMHHNILHHILDTRDKLSQTTTVEDAPQYTTLQTSTAEDAPLYSTLQTTTEVDAPRYSTLQTTTGVDAPRYTDYRVAASHQTPWHRSHVTGGPYHTTSYRIVPYRTKTKTTHGIPKHDTKLPTIQQKIVHYIKPLRPRTKAYQTTVRYTNP